MTIGTLIHQHPLKGTQQAVEVMANLAQQFPGKMQLLGVGEIVEFAKNKPEWLNYMLSPGREEMAHLMAQVDIWIIASHSEGLGRLTLEAMSAGCAIVSTDTGAEFLKDGENCLLAKIGDVDGLTKAAASIFANDELKEKLVTASLQTAALSSSNTEYKRNWNKIIGGCFEEG
jgi:glycosyltransferase involved in cell wall biosynthesis